MNTTNISIGQFYHAKYYEFDEKSEGFGNPVHFTYKTYDDTQYQNTRNQPMSGVLGSKYTLSIKTYDNLPFKPKDKVILAYDSKEYIITKAGELHNTTTSIMNFFFPKFRGNKPILLHLNKDDV